MVVALFYDEKDKGLAQMYEDVSKVQKYDDADIVFLKVNIARPELNNLASLYKVTMMPAFIFFYQGKRLIDNKNTPIILSGNASRDRLQLLIDQHYGTQIEQYVVRKDARNEQRLVREKESWKPYFYPRDMFVPSYGPEERDLE